jgi:hypothetical protein
MSKGFPNWKQRQKNLYAREGRLDSTNLSRIAAECLGAGYIQDAFEYYNEAKDRDGLQKLEKLAVEEGDAFLLLAIEKVTDRYSDDLWNKLGYKAYELGKIAFAQKAFERTANELMLAKIKQDQPGHDPQPA